MPRPTAPTLALLAWFGAGAAPAAGDAAPTDAPTFYAHVRPILKAYCLECHGEAAQPKGGLDLRLGRLLRAGRGSRQVVVAGRPDASLLLQRVSSGEMPRRKKKVSSEDIEVIRRWIAAGVPVEKPEPDTLAAGFQITDDDRQFWAFQPIRRPPVPEFRGPRPSVRNPIDAFLLARLEARGLSFAPEADR